MMPMPGRWLSCALIRCGPSLTLVDCGEGTQVPWKALGWGIPPAWSYSLDAYARGSCGGVAKGALHGGTRGEDGDARYLWACGYWLCDRWVETHCSPTSFSKSQIHELKDGENFPLPGGLQGSCATAMHGVPCLAYRFELERRPAFLPEQAQALGLPVQLWSRLQHGETLEFNGRMISPAEVLGPPRRGIDLAFITDTRPTKQLTTFAHDVDLLICESMYDNPEDLPLAKAHAHMLAKEAAGIALSAGARSLLLTHFSPKITDASGPEKAARSVFANVRAARDGLVDLRQSMSRRRSGRDMV